MSLVLEFLSGLLVVTGGLFVLAGGIGALRMPDFYTRVHGSSLTDSLGPVLILVGLMLDAGATLVSVKLAAILLFLMITSPTASYALCHAALLSGLKPRASKLSATPVAAGEEQQPQ